MTLVGTFASQDAVRACAAMRQLMQNGPLIICAAPAEWAVPQMLRIVACIHALYTPAGRQALAPIGAALDMAPQVGAGLAQFGVALSSISRGSCAGRFVRWRHCRPFAQHCSVYP